MSTLADLTDFEFPPEGKHPAALVRYVDLGTQSSKFGSTRQGDLAFELLGVGTADKPVLAFKRVFNLSPRSRNFREIVRALTGLHDIGGVDTRDLLGKWCEVDIEHVTNEEGITYANLECKPLRKQPAKGAQKLPKPATEFVFVSLLPDDFDPKELAKVSERACEKIESSPTYKTLMETGNFVAKSKGKTAAEIIDDGFPENLGV